MMLNTKKSESKQQLAFSLASFLMGKRETPVFLCVGSDKVVGDLLGVIVGEILLKKHHIKAPVFGSVDYSVNGKNLQIVVEYIRKNYAGPIVVIDGILGGLDEIGYVKYYPNGTIPGGEFGKGKYVGDFSILGVVEASGVDALTFLKSVRLKTIVEVADFIADSINMAYKFGLNLLNQF